MNLFDDGFAHEEIGRIATKSAGPSGSLPLTPILLRDAPSGDLFGLTQNAGMGWEPQRANDDAYLLLSTHGGVRGPDGAPVALGYHTGHWEVNLLVEEAARVISGRGGVPFAAFVSDPCDGRTQGTPGMMDSLPFRNDAALVFRRLIRSLPTRKGVLGVATCDKGLPAMMMALAGESRFPSVLVPGGVTLPPEQGEDAGKIQTIGARYAHQEITLEEAAELGCRACATPGGGCQFLGTAATAQMIAEALGMTVPHAALAPSGQNVWKDVARRSATVLMDAVKNGRRLADVLTEDAFFNAMAVHAAIGGSTNLLLHLPAIAFHAGRKRMSVEDWIAINRKTPRFVDALPNGPANHPTIRVYLAGGVPEVAWHLRAMGLLRSDARTMTGRTWDELLDDWRGSERRKRMRDRLYESDGVDPDDVVMTPAEAKRRGLRGTAVFPTGNLAPGGSVVKATAIDPSVLDADGVYRRIGTARVFTTETAAIAAVKSSGDDRIRPGDVIALLCRGPMGSGMEETYQITSALKHLPFGKQVALITDARFSGVSTGACIGHLGPEALAGGPIGKLCDGDLVEIVIDGVGMTGSVNLVGTAGVVQGREWGAEELRQRLPRPDLAPDPGLPDDTRLWAALQELGGGTWGGCVYDVDAVLAALAARVGEFPSRPEVIPNSP
jgi:putative YjhG/YagF family dehydratase